MGLAHISSSSELKSGWTLFTSMSYLTQNEFSLISDISPSSSPSPTIQCTKALLEYSLSYLSSFAMSKCLNAKWFDRQEAKRR